MKSKINYLLLLFLLVTLQYGTTQKQVEKENPMEVFKSLIGTWHAPDSIVNKTPQMQGRSIFKFEYDKAHSHIKLLEDFSITDNEDYTFTGIISFNPLTSKFEFFGVNAQRNYLFKGYFSNVTSNGFTREYDVYYPKDSYMANNFGQVISFQEDFVFLDENTMCFDIKYYNGKNKQYEMWTENKHVVIKEEQ
jgi:hypothetical protein